LLLAAVLTTAISRVILSRLAANTANHTKATPSTTQIPIEEGEWRGGDWGAGRGVRGCGPGPMGGIEASSEYTQKVYDILNSDEDVKNLLAQY
jgi:hypothetical protein